ncbi:snRNA-activating protein complex subunit 1, partial [Tupaia chinensis]
VGGMGTPAGLQADCETLLSRFQETDSVRFEDFTELWRNMKFGTIFCGKMRNLEKNTFTKEALALAWRYFLPPYTFQIRVGALYLLYGLYNTQLCQPKQKEMLNVHDHYQSMKNVISADKSKPDKALSLIKDDFFDNIKKIVLEHQQWHKDRKNPSLKSKVKEGEEKKEGSSQDSERCERAEALAKIKSKAFSVVVQLKRRKMSSRNKGNTKKVHKEDKPVSLSMPVITEEEEENESFSEKGTDELCQAREVKGTLGGIRDKPDVGWRS